MLHSTRPSGHTPTSRVRTLIPAHELSATAENVACLDNSEVVWLDITDLWRAECNEPPPTETTTSPVPTSTDRAVSYTTTELLALRSDECRAPPDANTALLAVVGSDDVQGLDMANTDSATTSSTVVSNPADTNVAPSTTVVPSASAVNDECDASARGKGVDVAVNLSDDTTIHSTVGTPMGVAEGVTRGASSDAVVEDASPQQHVFNRFPNDGSFMERYACIESLALCSPGRRLSFHA